MGGWVSARSEGAKRARVRRAISYRRVRAVAHRASSIGRVPGGYLVVTIPLLALIAAGHAAARSGALPLAAIPGLNAFVLYFALPCLLFRFGMNTPIVRVAEPGRARLLPARRAADRGFFTIVATLQRARRLKDAAFGALVGGLPEHRLHGRAAAGRAARADGGRAGDQPRRSPTWFVTSSLCIGIAQAHESVGPRHGDRGPARAARTLSNPLPWAILLGAAFSVAGCACPAASTSSCACSPTRLDAGRAVHDRHRAARRAGQHVAARHGAAPWPRLPAGAR